MASGSKREKFKAFFLKPFSSNKGKAVSKKGKVVSNDVLNETSTTSLVAGASAATVDRSPSPTTTVPNIVVSESSLQDTGISPSSGRSSIANASNCGPPTYNSDVLNETSTTSFVTDASTTIVDKSPSPSTTVPNIVVSESSLQVTGVPPSSGRGFFTNASHFSVNNPVMMDNPTVNILGASDRRSKAMERLSRHIIPGAAHDSSARDPPPRCHPGTRIEINKFVITWFYDKEKEEMLIWVCGPAGVGKSAIMQTLAEKLAESKHLGASAFVSRANGRNKSQRLFITIAYQLAVGIEDYCAFITEKLGRDPELVNKGMEEQFKVLIVEPFVENKIGTGSQPWGILLDGLDELDEHRAQRTIIRLISNFVLEHPDVPLLWLIASRPEPHICDTFDDETVVPAYQKKYVPANSKESCRDVERFLRDSLEKIQKDFPRTVSKKWPSEEQFSSLAAAASGLFAFADTAIRFIKDSRYANPTMRLRQVLSALNGLSLTASDDQPFAHLDALYAGILNSIPSDVWPTTKCVLGALLYAQGDGYRFVLRRLRPMSIVLGLDLETIYASVNSCYALLNASDPKHAYWKPTTFHHTSFSDFLLNSTRSQSFYISIRDVEDELLQSSLIVWQDFQTKCPPTSGLTYKNRWTKYFSALFPLGHNEYDLMMYIHEALFTVLVEKHGLKKERVFPSEGDKDQCFDLLCQLEDATICDYFQQIKKLSEFLPWLFDMWEIYQEELVTRGAIQQVGLKQVQFSQLGTCPARMRIIQGKSILHEQRYDMSDFGEILAVVSQLESQFPQLPVLACGRPEQCSLVFRHQANASDLAYYGLDASILHAEDPIWIYFAIPSSHSNFYPNAEHSLRANFQVISANHSQTMPENWPSQEQFQKLAGAVSHQPMFATIAMQFIGNPHYGNPITCLDQLLALIDDVDPSGNQPFIYVDALYSHILSSIPSYIWPTTQQVLGALLYGTESCAILQSPKGISVVLGIELNAVYTVLSSCSLMVQMPPQSASLETMVFHHYSFREYLIDPTRSKNFHISLEDAKHHMLKLLIKIWQDFKEFSHGIPESNYYSIWNKYCSQYHSDTDISSHLIADFNSALFDDTHDAPFLSIWQYDPVQLESKQSQDYVFHILSQLDFTTVCLGFRWQNRSVFIMWLFDIWKTYKEDLRSRGLFHQIQFQDLQLDHLEWYEVYSHVVHCISGPTVQKYFGNDPKSPEELEEYISGLQLFQQQRPQLRVLIGGCPGGRFAVFEYEYTEDDLNNRLHQPRSQKQKAGDLGYYILPYPDEAST